MHIHMHMHIYTHAHMHMHTHVHTHMYHRHTDTHIHMHTLTHIHAHTHIPEQKTGKGTKKAGLWLPVLLDLSISSTLKDAAGHRPDRSINHNES